MNFKNEKAEKFIRSYMNNFTSAKVDKWNYEDGCILTGLIKMYDETKDDSYKNFVLNYLKKYINEDGTINYYKQDTYHLDNVASGNALFFAYDTTGDEKYRRAIEVLMEQLRKQPRTKSGNFWHKDIYPNQIWLDGLYMSQVFYMTYETKFGGKEHYNDIITQFQNVRKYLFDTEKTLYYHGYDESKEAKWANKETGTSANFWLRAMGWYMIALIDTMSVMEQPVYEYYRALGDLFKEALTGLMKYQDKETGMFYQVIDHPEEAGNYLETSGSAMIAYAMIKACRMKVILAEKYEENALHILNSIIDTKLIEQDGKLRLSGICSVAGLGGDDRRDGSIAYYLSEPVVNDDHKGVGAFMMAYAESLKLN